MMYGWIITKDFLNPSGGEHRSAVGIMGPRGIPDQIVKDLKAGKGQRFRMLDDDNEVYYEGRYMGPNDESMFGPLDGYGTPNAGATWIQYWASGKGGGWETL